MPSFQQHLSNCSGELEPNAFHAQLRRLESLQALMTQGGTVVGEVAQFLIKAREELGTFQREQERYANAQEQLLEEKALLAGKLSDAQRAADAAALRVTEQGTVIARLQADLVARERQPSVSQLEAIERERKESSERLSSALTRIGQLEAGLQQERSLHQDILGQARREEASHHSVEISLLKDRLTALEKQLEAERQRRSRLMEVVKTHEVTVNTRQREPA